MKKILLSLYFLLLLNSIAILAQTETQGIVLEKAYTVEELSYGKIPKELGLSQVNPLDLIEAQMHRVYFRTDEKTFADGHHIFEMNLLNSADVFANWPVQVSRIVSDSTGTSMYDTTNVLWEYIPADSVYSADYNEVRSDLFADLDMITSPGFPMPDSAQLAQMNSEDYVIQLLEADAVRISNDEEEIFYEPQALRITTKNYEDGRLVSEDLLRYVTITDYGVVPVSEREVRYENRPSGLCMEKIRVRRYSDYRIEVAERSYPNILSNVKEVTQLVIWPNPVADAFFVQVPSDILPGSTMHILDASGASLSERSGIQPNTTLNFGVQHLPSGVYHLRTESLSGLRTQKFVKK